MCYTKSLEKAQILSELLDCSVTDLNGPDCLKNFAVLFTVNCVNHNSRQLGSFNKHCACEKLCFYVDWLTNERGNDEI